MRLREGCGQGRGASNWPSEAGRKDGGCARAWGAAGPESHWLSRAKQAERTSEAVRGVRAGPGSHWLSRAKQAERTGEAERGVRAGPGSHWLSRAKQAERTGEAERGVLAGPESQWAWPGSQ
jgi:hypothetical protein